jgi:hypothetical protein
MSNTFASTFFRHTNVNRMHTNIFESDLFSRLAVIRFPIAFRRRAVISLSAISLSFGDCGTRQ